MLRPSRFMLTGLLLCCAAVPAQADYPFGRVFTTAEERRQLDIFRETGESQWQSSKPAQAAMGSGATATRTDIVRFSGYVLRSDGSQMVWIDGTSKLSGSGNGAAGSSHGRVNRDDGDVVFRARSEQARLKPGQVWQLNENTISEVYEAPDTATVTTRAEASVEPE